MDIEVNEEEFMDFAEEMNAQADTAVAILMDLGWTIPDAEPGEQLF